MKLSIYDQMIMNLQGISVQIRQEFVSYFKTELGIEDIQIHASNIYLFNIPLQGEFTTLSAEQKKLIFEKELGLYEEQFDLSISYDNSLFDRFFEITWHGVIYCGEIKTT